MREIAKLHLQSGDQVRAFIESGGTLAQWEIPCQAIQSPILTNLDGFPDQVLRCEVHALVTPLALTVASSLLFFPHAADRGVFNGVFL